MLRYPLFVMSLSGSVIVVLYGLFYLVIKRYTSISWQRAILKSAIFFYLFPLPLFKESIVSFVCNSIPILMPKAADLQEVWVLDSSYAINLSPGNIFFGSEVLFIGILICGMGAIAFFVIGRQLKQNLAISRTYRSSAFSEKPSASLIEQFERVKEELGIKRKVDFICSPFCRTPVTIGMFFSAIVFPTADTLCLDPICYTYILKHELLHIKSRDTLTKLLLLVVLALHWYNPICYFLYREASVVCEMNCDHEVVRDCDEAVRQRYCNLMLELATKNHTEKEGYAIGLVNSNAAAYKRRILEMKTNRRCKFLLSCVIMLTVCLVGSITAFAYEPPQKMDLQDFKYEAEYTFSFPIEFIEPLQYDRFFIDEEGNIFPLGEENDIAICTHNFVKGKLSEHIKNSDGSCVVTTTEAWRCSICGYIKNGDVISEFKSTVCPH